jgi:hypothetical protein
MFRARCPICQKPMKVEKTADWPSFPFCSKRCKLIDLGRWLGERYHVPTVPEETDESVGEDLPAD